MSQPIIPTLPRFNSKIGKPIVIAKEPCLVMNDPMNVDIGQIMYQKFQNPSSVTNNIGQRCSTSMHNATAANIQFNDGYDNIRGSAPSFERKRQNSIAIQTINSKEHQINLQIPRSISQIQNARQNSIETQRIEPLSS